MSLKCGIAGLPNGGKSTLTKAGIAAENHPLCAIDPNIGIVAVPDSLLEHGFIRAEVIAYDDFIACNGEQGAKEAGKMRLEGKGYIVKEGDVVFFRFNV